MMRFARPSDSANRNAPPERWLAFTLIELLVVIAIIGILASVVLVSLNSARQKGSTARVQEETSQVRTQLESDYANGVYPDLTGAASHIDVIASGQAGSANLTTITGDIVSQNGGAFGNTNGMIIYSTAASAVAPTDYAIFSKSAGTNTGYFCIDSTGKTVVNTTAAAIPAFSATCV